MTGDTDADAGDEEEQNQTRGDDGLTIRRGVESDLLAVLRILEGAMLKVGANQIRTRTESGEVLVAERDGRVVGALVRDGVHVEAVAVHPDRRGAGIGTRLVEAVLAETGRVTVEFREEVRPFYEAMDFEIKERADETQLWGERWA